MNSLNIILEASKLINFMDNKKFDPVTQRIPYFHMGATITDAVLQSGLNYKNVVYPRVEFLLNNFEQYKTTCDFIILFQTIHLRQLIRWKNEKKIQLIEELSWYFFNNSIENEMQLATWLEKDENVQQIMKIRGIGFKTVDYLKMLTGMQTIAIDRHLFKFLEMAGIVSKTYNEAELIYCKAAELMNVSKYELDRKIWLYMSKTSSL